MQRESLGLALVGAAVLGAGLAPLAGKGKSDERLEAIETSVKKLERRAKDLDARLVHVEDLQSSIDDLAERTVPKDARWIELETGRAQEWSFDLTGKASVQFVRFDDAGLPVFHLRSVAMEGDVSLRAGQSVRAVDDLGQRRTIVTTAVHRLELDRTGAARRALVSVLARTEGG